MDLQIQQDFKELYPGREDALISKWDSIKEVLIDLCNIDISPSDDYGKKLLIDYSVTDQGIYSIQPNFIFYYYVICIISLL